MFRQVYFSHVLLSIVCVYELHRRSGHSQRSSANRTFTANERRPGPLLSLGQITVFLQISEQSHRGLLGENYLIVSILLVRRGCGHSYCHRSLYTFSLTLSLFPRSLSRCHICSFSLRTDFEGKSQRARC